MIHVNRMPVLSILLLGALLVDCAAPAVAPSATPIPPTETAVPSMATPTSSPSIGDEVKVETGWITSEALAGNLFGDPTTRRYSVILPPSYSTSDKRYPVVYVLHWYTGSYTSMVELVLDSYRKALLEGNAQEMIFVFPDASNMLGGSQYLGSPTIGDYETYITQELVDIVDARYRTIGDRNSRGVTGCSMGGDGSIYLALKYPGVYSVTAPVSGTYDWSGDTALANATEYLKNPPENTAGFTYSTPWQTVYLLSWAAATASNPDKPPFYLDMPVAVVNGEPQIVPEVVDKMIAADPVHELERYLSQSERLNAILIYHGANDPIVPVGLARDFDKLLKDRDIEHEYLEATGGHCDFTYDPVVKFMSEHLVGETSG